MKQIESFLREAFHIGTPQCAVIGGVIGLVLATLLLWLGFWRTVFICLLVALGVFMGGVKNKSQFCKNCVNKLLPDNKTNDKI